MPTYTIGMPCLQLHTMIPGTHNKAWLPDLGRPKCSDTCILPRAPNDTAATSVFRGLVWLDNVMNLHRFESTARWQLHAREENDCAPAAKIDIPSNAYTLALPLNRLPWCGRQAKRWCARQWSDQYCWLHCLGCGKGHGSQRYTNILHFPLFWSRGFGSVWNRQHAHLGQRGVVMDLEKCRELLDQYQSEDQKFHKACRQINVLNRRIDDVIARYERAYEADKHSHRRSLRLQLSTLEAVRDMFYEYACQRSDSLEQLRERLLSSGFLTAEPAGEEPMEHVE